MVGFQDKGEILANFLGSYYYQQSEFDFENDLTPVLDVKRADDPRYIKILRERMIELAQHELDEDALHATLFRLGAQNVPALDGSVRNWLARAIHELTTM